MTVAELIEQLRQLPQDLKVTVNDEDNGNFYNNMFLYHWKPEEGNPYDDEECVVLVVNEVV
mgnify:CR=1 FL=1|jgi:hypothetical protein